MSEHQRRMLEAFAEYERRDPAAVGYMQNVIGMPLGSRLQRIIRLPNGWRLWLATRDYIYGTYLELHDTGRIIRITTRSDEGDEILHVRPSDEEIRNG